MEPASTARGALPAPVGLFGVFVIYVVSGVVGALLIQGIAALIAGAGATGGLDLRLAYGLSSVIMLGITLGVLWIHRATGTFARAFAWRGWPVVAIGVGSGFALKAIGDVLVSLETLGVARVTVNNPLVINPQAFAGPWALLWLILGVVVAAPVAEELLFRGLLYGWLRRYLPLWPAALLAGLGFGVAHRAWTLVLPLGAVGVGLCYLYERFGSLWPSAAAHGTLNAISLLLALMSHPR